MSIVGVPHGTETRQDDSDVNSTVTLTTTWTMWAPVPNVTYGVGNMCHG